MILRSGSRPYRRGLRAAQGIVDPIDWIIKEDVRAKLKVLVKRILRKYGYPPDMQKLATETVLKQAEKIADELTAAC